MKVFLLAAVVTIAFAGDYNEDCFKKGYFQGPGILHKTGGPWPGNQFKIEPELADAAGLVGDAWKKEFKEDFTVQNLESCANACKYDYEHSKENPCKMITTWISTAGEENVRKCRLHTAEGLGSTDKVLNVLEDDKKAFHWSGSDTWFSHANLYATTNTVKDWQKCF